MVWKIFKKRRYRSQFVDPDEIFLDSHNLADLDQQQFEGRIEKPIRKKTIIFFGGVFLLFMLVFAGKLFELQIKKGQAYYDRSENNTLLNEIIFAERGIIYDRNQEELAWSKISDQEDEFPTRAYLTPGFSHILGHVTLPAKDQKGLYWQTEYTGKDGLELTYNEDLAGVNGARIIELDALGNIHSENTAKIPQRGKDIYTSIDSRLQGKMYELIENFAEDNSFQGGAGIIMDIDTGELLVSTSYPEYDNEVLSLGEDKEKIASYLLDKRNIFLDKTISGLYTPGSIVKPIFALAALEEGVIDPFKEILSTGKLEIPNPYFPDQPTIFRDWKAHGWTDLSEAIAVSSDVYFYTIGGGFEDQKGVGIDILEKYAREFGLDTETGIDLPDEITGVIPSRAWKEKHFEGDPWRVGDTYNTSIGQYGFQVTPMEMVRATGALASDGRLVTPHFLLGDRAMEAQVETLRFNEENLSEVLLGMREAVTMGTAVALNVDYIDIAGKTGTAQVGISKSRVNSWIVGFFPYEDPKYAFTILMESGPSQGEVGASRVMRGLADWMYWNTPEYFGLPPWPSSDEEEELEEVSEETEVENHIINQEEERYLDDFMLIDE